MSDGRTSSRHRVAIQGEYRTGSGQIRHISLIDISEGGCRFRDRRSGLMPHIMIALKVHTIGPFDARVVWIDRDTVGVVFAKPLYGPVFDHIRNVLDSA